MPFLRTLAVALLPWIVLAQSSEESWSNLSRLRRGQSIQVVDTRLRPSTGSFVAVSEREISLQVGGSVQVIPRGDVLSVKNRERSHRVRNVLLGLAIGAAGGVAAGVALGAANGEDGEAPVFLLVSTPIGAGIGAAVGAALPAGSVTVYRAKPGSRP